MYEEDGVARIVVLRILGRWEAEGFDGGRLKASMVVKGLPV